MLTAALVVAFTTGAAITVVRRRRGIAARPEPRRDLAVLAMQLGRGIRSGLTPLEVLEESSVRMRGTLGVQLVQVCAHMRRGASLDSALVDWERTARVTPSAGWLASRVFRRTDGSAPHPDDVELLAAAARFGHGQGRGQAEVFEAVGATMIDRAEVADEVHALTAQARASVVVLCALPAMGLLMLAVLDPSLGTVLFTEQAGLASLWVAVGLDLLALWLGSRLVRRALR